MTVRTFFIIILVALAAAEAAATYEAAMHPEERAIGKLAR